MYQPDLGAFPGETERWSFNYLMPLDGLPFLLLRKALTLILRGANIELGDHLTLTHGVSWRW